MMNTEDQINELLRRIEAIDQINELLRRIEAIEQRQAKLACSESSADVCDSKGNGTSEDEQWEELADMLGFESVHYMLGWMEGANGKAAGPMPGLCDERQIVRAFKAMLHGLACLECFGAVWNEGKVWNWECRSGKSDAWDWTDSHPKSLIAMLRAYREGDDAK